MSTEPTSVPSPDRHAFAALARRHHRGLLAYARALTREQTTSADLVQEAFVAAWRNLGRFDVTRDFGAWLRGIIRNKWREHLRRHSREVDVDEDTLEAWEARFAQWDAGHDKADSGVFEALEDCLARLPETLREAVRRFYYLEEPGETIATGLGINAAALRKRLQRARQALHDCLARKFPTRS